MRLDRKLSLETSEKNKILGMLKTYDNPPSEIAAIIAFVEEKIQEAFNWGYTLKEKEE